MSQNPIPTILDLSLFNLPTISVFMPTRMEINLDNIFATVAQGINRTVIFLGLGLNAGKREDFTEYRLSTVTETPAIHYGLVPEDASLEAITEYKNAFCLWITGCGLRELVESYSLYFDQLYDTALVIERIYDGLDEHVAQRRFRQFHRKGLEAKISELLDRYEIAFPYTDEFASLNAARNCITHRLGVVREVDFNDSNSLLVRWRGMDTLLVYEDGSSEPFADRFGVPLERPASVQMQIVQKTKRFEFGQLVHLSTHELWEICFFAHLSAQELLKLFIKFAQRRGIEVATA